MSLSIQLEGTSSHSEGQTGPVTQDGLETEAVVAGWWRYQRLAVGSRAERKALELGEPGPAVAAAEAVEDRVRSGGPEALHLVAALVRAAETDDDLARVGAGPLEDLLTRNGAALVDDIDDLARRDPQFAQALTAVWWSAEDAGPEVTVYLGRWIPALQR